MEAEGSAEADLDLYQPLTGEELSISYKILYTRQVCSQPH